ncbi:Putative protein of unknown function [Podospora comata]|uniref:Uncharacterized protein n=1 Tax=Podospora comata TaxID=48703 RepID=A0ABY6S5D4_PODCO|nr:Putative protein of unknown function [Podospora comata]
MSCKPPNLSPCVTRAVISELGTHGSIQANNLQWPRSL